MRVGRLIHPRLKHLVAVMAACLCTPVAADEVLRIRNAWVPAAPPAASVFAAYMSIDNTSDRDVNIVEFSSPHFAAVEMHRTVLENGMAQMIQQSYLVVPAHGTLELAPQSWHLMMIKPSAPVVLGEDIAVSLTLENGQVIEFPARVKTPAVQ